MVKKTYQHCLLGRCHSQPINFHHVTQNSTKHQ